VPKDKVKERLEQLDQFEEDESDVVETVTMTQKDFIKIIEKFHKNLQSAWGSDQRRDALRIAIKVRGEDPIPAQLLLKASALSFRDTHS
jgi:hypothetical protein